MTEMSSSQHDAFVAQVSHVPHLAAIGLTLAAQAEAMGLSAGGFSDMTRVAQSDPALWREICLTNRRSIIQAMNRFLKELNRLHRLIAKNSGHLLAKQFRTAQRRRLRLKQ